MNPISSDHADTSSSDDSDSSSDHNISGSDLTRQTYAILERMALKSVNPSQHGGRTLANPRQHTDPQEEEEDCIFEDELYGWKQSPELPFQSQSRHRSQGKVRNQDDSDRQKARLDSASPDTTSDSGGPIKNRRNLYISNLDPGVTESELRARFEWYGTIQSTNIMRNRGPGGLGCAFVCFASHEQARSAQYAMNGVRLRSHRLRVDFAFTRKTTHPAEIAAKGPARTALSPLAPELPTRGRSETAIGGKKVTATGGKGVTAIGGRNEHSTGGRSIMGGISSSRSCEADTRSRNVSEGSCEVRNGGGVRGSKTGETNGKRSGGERQKTLLADDCDAEEDGQEEETDSDSTDESDKETEEEEEDKEYREDDCQSHEEHQQDKDIKKEENTTTNTREERHKARSSDQTAKTRHEPTSIKDHIENILAQVEDEIKGAFEIDKKALVITLKAELEADLSKNFDAANLHKMIEHGLGQVEQLIKSLVAENFEETIWEQLAALKTNIQECFESPNKVNETKKRENVAKIMTGIVDLEKYLKVSEEEDSKKARLVAQLIVISEKIDAFFRPDDARNIRKAQIEEQVLEIQEANTIFLTPEVKSRRQTRLDQIKHSLESVDDDKNSQKEVKTALSELKENIKVGYLQDALQPNAATKRVQKQLTKLRTNLSSFADDRDARLAIVDELSHIREEIHAANVDSIRKFIQSQKEDLDDRLSAETNAMKRDNLRDDFGGDFWTEMEKFLVESFNKPATEGATVGRDNSINLYVNNLAPSFDCARLRREFRRFGDIVSARAFTTKPNTFRRSPGQASSVKTYGFVRFSSAADAVRAMKEMNGTRLMSRVIEVSVATGEENTKSYWRYLLEKAIQK